MKVFLVEHRQVDKNDNGTWDWETVVMFVGSSIETARKYCVENAVEQLEDTETRASWFVICEHTVDLDDPCDGEWIETIGLYGVMDEQPCYGYQPEHRK